MQPHPQKKFYEEKVYYLMLPHITYAFSAELKNATQNLQAPQERHYKLFLHKHFWGCGCTCMHSGFLIDGYYTITPPQKVT